MKHYLQVAKFTLLIKKELFIRILLGLSVTASYVGQAICLARGTSLVFRRTSFREAAVWYIGVACLILIRAMLTCFLEGYTKQTAGKVKTILRERMIEKLLLLGPAYQADKRSGKLQSLITDGVEYLEPYLVNYIPQIFVVAFSVIPMVIYILQLNWISGLILVIAVVLAIVVPHIMMPFTSKASIGYWREYAVLNAQYVDTMQGMNTLKLFAADGYKGEELHRDSENFRKRQITNTRNSLFSSAAITMMMAIGTSVTACVAAYACNDDRLSYAALLNIMFLVIECIRPIGEMNNAWHSSYLGLSVSNEFLEIMGEPVIIQSPLSPEHLDNSKELPTIAFHNVSFQYNNKREKALDQVSFRIQGGNTAAFVGRSGAGKSTLVNLLLRFYDADQGTITIDGRDIRDIDLQELRSYISVVFQNTYLFYGTIKENIRMARPEASDEEVYEAARAAHAHEFITQLEKGYETIVGERGLNLSGGQRQRIAIARAVLKKAPVLILDEATSSVDVATESLIQETLKELKGNYTTIVIAHRLSTIQYAETIYVLENGKLKEKGSHEQLLAEKGAYLSLVEAQKKGIYS